MEHSQPLGGQPSFLLSVENADASAAADEAPPPVEESVFSRTSTPPAPPLPPTGTLSTASLGYEPPFGSRPPTAPAPPSAGSSRRPPPLGGGGVGLGGGKPPPLMDLSRRRPSLGGRSNASIGSACGASARGYASSRGGEGTDDEGGRLVSRRAKTTGGSQRKPMMLSLSGSLSSLKTSLNDPLVLRPETPLPNRNDYREITGRVEVVVFDFDGTLTATPGDQQVRINKRVECCERAPMLRPHLQALREAGCVLAIMSKSTQGTISDALTAAGLIDLFDGPIFGKALGFEGKVGFIKDLASRGMLRKSGDRRVGPAGHKILLVDDDVLELERAAAGGLQTYAVQASGGLTNEDFAKIIEAQRLPASRPLVRPVTTGLVGTGRSMLLPPGTISLFSSSRDDSLLSTTTSSKGGSRWRNLILFSGECFEG